MTKQEAIQLYNAFLSGPAVGCDHEGNIVEAPTIAQALAAVHGMPPRIPSGYHFDTTMKSAAKALRELADALEN